jgi:RNA polymerase sigma-70 factor (ECF subfamily)
MLSSPTNRLLQPFYRMALLRDGAGLSDEELLEGFIAHREGAYFEALVRRHGPMVLGVCRRVLRDCHDAEDAFQAAFLVLAQRAVSIVPRQLVGNWLHGVAYRTALEARRRGARRRAREKQVNDMPHPRVEEPPAWQALLPLLDRELDRLPAKYRAAVVLCHLEGRTRKEAASQLGLPVGTLSGRLTTAMRLLARHMRRHGLALSGTALATALLPSVASASVPAALLAETIKATPLAVAGQAIAPVAVSAEVAALTKGVLKSMLLAKLKLATVVLLTLAALGGGASVFTYRTLEAGQATVSHKDQAGARENRRRPEPSRPEDRPATTPPRAETKRGIQKSDKEMLQGYWVPIAAMVDGKKVSHDDPKLKKWRLIFRGDTVTVPGSQEVAYTLNPRKQPREIDIQVNETITPMKAIYEFDGKHLRLSWIKSGQRPADFDTARNKSVLIVFTKGE